MHDDNSHESTANVKRMYKADSGKYWCDAVHDQRVCSTFELSVEEFIKLKPGNDIAIIVSKPYDRPGTYTDLPRPIKKLIPAGSAKWVGL